MSEDVVDVLIIGAGASGAAIAWSQGNQAQLSIGAAAASVVATDYLVLVNA